MSRSLDILAIFAEAGDHGRLHHQHDGVWRQWSTPYVDKAARIVANNVRSRDRHRNEPAVRAAAAERHRREVAKVKQEQDARVLAAAQKLAPDGLARARALCAECKRKAPGAGWCAAHERIQTMRHKLEKTRDGITHKFVVWSRKHPDESPDTDRGKLLEEITGYVTANVDKAGRLGEIFIRIGKEGGIGAEMDDWAVAVCQALQYGAPVKNLFEKFTHKQYPPYGRTENPQIPSCTSLKDYVSKFILMNFSKVTNWEAPEVVDASVAL